MRPQPTAKSETGREPLDAEVPNAAKPPAPAQAQAQAADSNSSGLKPSCLRCASYLAEALTSATATPDGPVRSLLDAMGATATLVHNKEGGGNPAVESHVTVPAVPRVKGTAVEASANKSSERQQTIQHIDAAAGALNNTNPILMNIRRRLTEAAVGNVPILDGGGMAVAATSAVQKEVAQTNADGDDNAGSNDDGSISVSIACQQCSNTGPEGGARAYVRGPNPLSIVLCSNRLHSPAEVQEVLVHELIHVYDMRRGLDFHDCHQLAYSEVRAARDAECRSSLNRFTLSYCVKERAGHATNNMFPHQEGGNCVGRVLEAALADRSPFHKGGAADDLPDFTKYCSPK